MPDREEIIALETRFWDAMRDKDVDAATALMAEKSIVTGAQGASAIDRKAFAGMMDGGKWTLHDYTFDGIEVVFSGEDSAVIGYKVTEKITMDGKAMTLTAADASAWNRIGGKWLCTLHTESILGDPFGQKKD